MKRPLRLLLVSTYYRPVVGGAEASTERLAQYLARTGHHVRLLTRRPSADVPWTESANGVNIRRLPPTGRRSAAGKWLWLPWLFAALIREECDVICVSDQRGSGIAGWAAARLRGRPVLIQPHTEGSLSGRHPDKRGLAAMLNRALTWPVRSIYGRADAVAGITRSILDEARRLGIADSRLHYLPNPFDARQFAPVEGEARRRMRETLGWRPDDVVFLFTGRLSIEKGLKELLRAWRGVVGAGWRLVLVGPAMAGHQWDLGGWLDAFVHDHALEGSVTRWGQAPPQTVARLMSAADAAVLPSYYEAHPLAAVEAMACGLPIVASRVGSVPDFVVPGENGLLVPPRDVPALAAALREMVAVVTDEPRRARWRAAARSAALAFDEDAVLPRYVGVLEDLAGASSATVQGT